MDHVRREAAIAHSPKLDHALKHKRGLTLVEVAIGLALVTIVLTMVAQAMDGLQELSDDGEVEAQLASSGNRALREMLGDLKHSGFVTEGPLSYPHLFQNGDAGFNFPVHDHAPAETIVDYGAAGSREVIYRLPQDADADGIPDLDANGALIWDPREFSFVLVTGADGINRLQRRVDGAEPRTIAKHVDRVIVENSLLDFSLPLDALSVRIDMAIEESDESMHTLSLQSTVRVRNGGN